MELDNREIAILVWTAILIGAASINSDVRRATSGVVRAFFSPIILCVLSAAGVWIIACIMLLATIGIWQWSNFKTTLIWGITFAFLMIMDINRISEDDAFFGKTLRDIVGATVIVEFIAEFQTFGLLTELILIPFLSMVTIFVAVAESKPEFSPVQNVGEWLLAITGLSFLVYSLYHIANNFSEFATLATLQNFAIPIILSLVFLPFICALSTYLVYERTFTPLLWLVKNREIRIYAKRRAFLSFGLNLDLLRRWRRYFMRTRPTNKVGIDKSINEVKILLKREKNPPPVNPSDGWSPYIANGFMAAEGLVAGDYYPSSGEWYAESTPLDLSKDVLPDNIVYFIEGDEFAAKRLKLKLNVTGLPNSVLGEEKFREFASVLLQAVLDDETANTVAERLHHSDDIDEIIYERRIRTIRDDWGEGSTGGYSRTLIIDYSPEYQSPY